MLRTDFRPYRDELIVSTKAGYGMWPGPYGEWGSRKYLLASLDQSLKRMGLDYVDIFYSHRFDPDTPLEETMGALDTAVRQGKALYVGISSYNSQPHRARPPRSCATSARPASSTSRATPCSTAGSRRTSSSTAGGGGHRLHRASRRWRRACSPTNISPASRPTAAPPAVPVAWRPGFLSDDNLAAIRGAATRSPSSAARRWPQMALAWVLRDPRVTSALIGASRAEQIDDAVGATKSAPFTAAELAEIDRYAKDAGVNIWRLSSAS